MAKREASWPPDNWDGAFTVAVEVVRVSKNYVWLDGPRGFGRNYGARIRLKRKDFPDFGESDIGNFYRLRAKEPRTNAGVQKSDVVFLEEMLHDDGRHMKDVLPEETWLRLIKLSTYSSKEYKEDIESLEKEIRRKKREIERKKRAKIND